MTILPKKKQPKDKNDSENSERSNSPSSVESGAGRGSLLRVRNASPTPQRWASPPPNDHSTLDRHEESTSHVVSNKRRIRDRSSPHRSVRKQRHDTRLQTTSQSNQSRNVRSSGTVQKSHMMENEEEERAGFNSEDECQHKEDVSIAEKEKKFELMLVEKKGFKIKKMAEDGACLFRAVADQVFGDQEMHSIVRNNCVEYMAKNMDFFKQFVTEDFGEYLKRKKLENCYGNHIEMQALCELYNRPIEVYQMSLEPINTFHATYETDNEPIRLSYHRNVHYNSVVNPFKATIGVGLGLPEYHPGLADRMQVRDAVRQSEDSHIEQTMLEDKLRETDWELTQDTIEEQVARESYLQWVKEQEQESACNAQCSSTDKSDLKLKATSTTTSTTLTSVDSVNHNTVHYVKNNSKNNNNNSKNRNSSLKYNPSNDASLKAIDGASSLCQCTSSSASSQNNKAYDDGYGAVGYDKPLFNSSPVFGLSDWYAGDDDDLMQALAESQKQYFIELKKHADISKSFQSTSSSLQPSSLSSSSSSSSPPSSESKEKEAMQKTK